MSISVSHLTEHIRPHGNEEVKVTECGNVIEVQFSLVHARGSPIRKLDKDFYLDERTGEIKPFEHHDKRLDDIKSLKRTFADARDLINTNIPDPSKCLFVTLTYAENMQNTEKLYNDFQNFWKRKIRPAYPGTEYICAAEPQGRGAWHIHMLLLFPEIAPFIPNEQMRKMWGHGFVTVRCVASVDNVGAYLTAYLTNIPLDEITPEISSTPGEVVSQDFLDENGVPIPKKVKKGARLYLYPSSMRIFRWSNGIVKPDSYYTTATHAEELVDGLSVCWETTKQITDTESGFSNTINYRQYNKNRKELKP